LLGKESGSASLNRRDGLELNLYPPSVRYFVKNGVP